MANLKLRSTTSATDPGSTSAKGSALTHAEMDSNLILINNSKLDNVTDTFTGTLTVAGSGGSAVGAIQLNDNDDSNSVTIKALGTIASSYTLTLPPDDGTSGQVLTTDGAGVLTFTDKTALTSLDIDSFTDGTSITVAATDKLLIQDGTTEKKINASQMLDYVETGITMTGDLTSTAGDTALGATTMSGDINTQANALTGTTVTPSTGENGGFSSSDSRAVRLQGPTAGKDHAIIMQQGTGSNVGKQNLAFVIDIDGSYSGVDHGGGNIGSGLIYSPLNMQIRDRGESTKTRTTFDIGVPYRGNTGSTITQGGVTGKLLDVVAGDRKIYLQGVSGGSFATSTATTGVVTGTVTAVNSIGTNAVELTYDTDFATTAATSDLADIGFARLSARDVLNTNGMRTSEPELHFEAGRIAFESNGTKQIDIEDAGGMTLTTRSNGDIKLQPNGTGEIQADSAIRLSEVSAPTNVTDKGFIYAKNDSGTAEVFVMDAAGNETKISPHNEAGEWQYFSKNVKTGKTVRINMEAMIRDIEQLTGKTYIENE